MKRTWFQAKIKQDIAISTQIEHERHSTHKRGILLTREDHIAFLQKEAIHKHIYPKATKSIVLGNSEKPVTLETSRFMKFVK
jgi:4'-phosphopantetheinyl transferase EntD